MLTLIKEDGTGRTDANSYANVADGDAYHEAHLYATTWTAASTAHKEAALVMATRLIDAGCEFSGSKRSSDQALQWPRAGALDPDRPTLRLSILYTTAGSYFESDRVPPAVVNATCEMARELLAANRTDNPPGEGLASLSLAGALSMTFDKQDRPPMLSHLARTMLAKWATFIEPGRGPVRLIRT